MQKIITLLSLICVIAVSNTGRSQYFSAYGLSPTLDDFIDITSSNDTLKFNFASLPAGAYTDGDLSIEIAGYFNPGSYYQLLGPNMDTIGTVSQVYNCAPFNPHFTIPMATINSYGGSGTFKFVKNGSINPWCNDSRIKVRFSYYYCPTGVPTAQAAFSLNDTYFCQTDSPLALIGSPAGGIFSGAGVSNNTLTPLGISAGNHMITYTYTEANGCYTQDSLEIIVKGAVPNVSNLVCVNTTPSLNTGTIPTAYSHSIDFNPLVASGTAVTLPAITTSPTIYYVAPIAHRYLFQVDSIDTTGFQLIDHETITGDDRGGMAITDNYVYIVGDDATGRFDLNMQNGISLPRRDGMFTDLAQRKLYTFYNTTIDSYPDYDNSSEFQANALRSLNEDLSYGDEIITLSTPISMGYNDHNIILAGYNQVIVGDCYGNYEFHKINILSGQVSSLGTHYLSPYGSETWSDWGLSGTDTSENTGYFFNDNGLLVKYDFDNQTSNPVLTINDFSDASSMIYHPVNQRLYIHYEGSTGTFGGADETMIYLAALASDSTLPLIPTDILCPSEYEYTFNSIELGADTTVCSEDGFYILEGGFGFESYTWNGVNNNYNVYLSQASEEVVLTVTDEINCQLTDSIAITFEDCTAGISDLNMNEFVIYPVPNDGNFAIAFGTQHELSDIRIADATGKIIYSTTIPSGESILTVDLNVAPGVYFVQVSNGSGTTQQPVTIH